MWITFQCKLGGKVVQFWMQINSLSSAIVDYQISTVRSDLFEPNCYLRIEATHYRLLIVLPFAIQKSYYVFRIMCTGIVRNSLAFCIHNINI
jgi:hypothetical protein